jgi:hypothetical protein
MSAARCRLTEALIHDIALRVQGGAFPHVAAEAAGVPAAVFHDWMRRGTERGARDPYRALARRVRHAHAHARCMAEVALRNDDPRTWLLHGPGKDSADLPGWSAPARAPADTGGRTANVLLDPHLQALLAAILDVLAPYPEARAAVAAALAEKASSRPAAAESAGPA